ncbi:MAG: DUF1289 domain-containing protein [Alteromonadaceae bacterium]|nr:DUF1289 domain-containing protein [Alteromonadaceae bacterium]
MADNKQPSQLELFTVPSPCIGLCQSGAKGYCKGCFRSREERLYWLQVDDSTRRVILDACKRRKRYYNRRKAASTSADLTSTQQDLFNPDAES